MILIFFSLLFYLKKHLQNFFQFTVCIYATLIFSITEVLSFFDGITTHNIRLVWGIFSFLSGFYLAKNRQIVFQNIKDFITVYGKKYYLFFIWFFILFLFAILIVPNNWDSMTYHLARVENWVENKNVSYYITNIPRQIFSPVLAEYVLLNLRLLLDSDLASNLVQFFCYFFNFFVILDICDKLNFQNATKFILSLLYLSIPMAIAQSMTTQTDLVGSLFFLIFIDSYLDLYFAKNIIFEKNLVVSLITCAMSIGLVYISKSTPCIGIIVFLVALMIKSLCRKDLFKNLLFFSGIATIILFVIISLTLCRNYNSSGDIFGKMNYLTIGSFSPDFLILNAYKNFSLLLACSYLKEILVSVGENFSNFLGLNIDDPLITLAGNFADLPVSYHHDVASSCFVACLFFVSIFCSFMMLRKEKFINFWIFSISIFLGLAIVKYQIWGGRLLLPFAISMLFPIGIFFDNFSYKLISRNITITLIVLCCSFSALSSLKFQKEYSPFLFTDVDKNQMYFFHRSEEYIPYKYISDVILASSINKIGLFIGRDSYEYPLWKFLKLENKDIKIQHVVYEKSDYNYSAVRQNTFVPQCIIAIHQGIYSPLSKIKLKNGDYYPKFIMDDKKDYAIFCQKNVVLEKKFKTHLIKLNEKIHVKNFRKYLGKGWSFPEKDWIWSDGNSAEMNFKIKNGENKSLKLKLDAIGIIPQNVGVYTNSIHLSDIKLGTERKNYIIVIPKNVMQTDMLNVKFKINKTVRPFDDGNSLDKRALGIRLFNLKILLKE